MSIFVQHQLTMTYVQLGIFTYFEHENDYAAKERSKLNNSSTINNKQRSPAV